MLRDFLKKLGYRWKRFRKSLKKKQNPKEYNAKFEEIKQLLSLYRSGYIDLFFGDESGFNMQGYVPYGWQPTGEYIHITPQKTAGTQVFGFMSLANELHAYTYKGSANSELVISFMDDFHKNIKKPTVVVLDNAPIHHSNKFEEKIQQWKQDDLFVFFLPAYSPHLNPIEILWRKAKYEWIKYEDIQSQQQLDAQLEKILIGFGSEYTINFKEQSKEVSNIFN